MWFYLTGRRVISELHIFYKVVQWCSFRGLNYFIHSDITTEVTILDIVAYRIIEKGRLLSNDTNFVPQEFGIRFWSIITVNQLK